MRNVLLLSTLVAVFTGCSMSDSADSPEAFSTVTYRGEIIPLSRQYADFHDYRDDVNNLPKSEHARVAALVKNAPVPESFASRKEADDAFLALMFPGYGFSWMQIGEPVALYSIEVPQTTEDRWLALVERDSRWVVVDDFIWNTDAGYIRKAEYVAGHLEYSDPAGNVLRRN
jgi:hypothetical protein